MGLLRFIKKYWAALGGAVLLLWLEFQMDWVGFPYGNEAQKTVNILLLMASFISVLTWNGRAEQRKAELLQITLLVCEAYVVNVDIFSNRVNHWSDLYTNGWNLTWAIGGSLEILEISGLLGIIVRSVLQAIFHLTENLRGAVRWLEQIVRQCDKALLFETIGGVLADWLFISYSGLNQKPEQTILWAIVFGTLWIIAWTIIRLFVCIRKKLLVEVREISIRSSFSIIGEGLILIGLGTLAFWSLSIQQSSVKIILLLLIIVVFFTQQLKKIFQNGKFHRFWENSGIAPEDLAFFIRCVCLTGWIFIAVGISQESGTIKIEDLTKLLDFLKTGMEVLEKFFP